MKRLSFFAVAVLACSMAFAGPVTEDEAQKRAAQFLTSRQQGTGAKAIRLAKSRPSLQSSVVQAEMTDAASYHVFNIDADGGFVIVSGDDRAPAILGYADSGHFDADNIPDNMREWLRGYEEQMKWIGNSEAEGATSRSAIRKSPTVKRSVTPLLTTKWNQENPYNILNDPQKWGFPTGCVATAMAQVLNYHGQLTGKPEMLADNIPNYPITYNTNQGKITLEFGNIAKGTVIDWENMQDIYIEDAPIETEEQQKQVDAVAQLMYMCGSSVMMKYSQSGSTAGTINVPEALKKYFGYDAATRLVNREDYTEAGWEEIICNELLEGRPVIHSGNSSGGGHAFVIDGFDGDEMFHINWGWGGNNDGYFLLSIARPDDKTGAGAGNSDDGYTLDQKAVIGAQPDAGIVPDGLQLTFEKIKTDNNTIKCSACNYNTKAATFDVGIGYIDDSGNIDYIKGETHDYNAAKVLDGTRISREEYPLTFSLNSIKRDTCKIVLISREKGDIKWLTPMNAKDHYIEAVRTSAGIKLTLKPKPLLKLEGLTLNRNTSGKSKQQIEAQITNTGDEFYGELTLTTQLVGSSISTPQQIGATIPNGETTTVSFSFSPNQVGDYKATISYVDKDGKNVELGTETIHAPAKVSNDVNIIVDIKITNINSSGRAILGNKAHLIATLWNNEDDDYEGTFEPHVLKIVNGRIETNYNINVKQFVAAHDSVVFEEDFDVEIGGRYELAYIIQKGNTVSLNRRYTYSVLPAVTMHKANGYYLAQEATESVEVPADVIAVDMTGNDITKMVTPSDNANCLYYLSDDAETPEGLTVNIVKGTHCDSLHIYDDALPFKPIADFAADTVAYTRIFDNGITAMVIDGDTIVNPVWSTICLPFTADRCQLADGTDVDWMRQDNDSTSYEFWLMEYLGDEFNTLFFSPAQELRAYTPYMIAVPGERLKDLPNMTGTPVTFYGGNAKLRTSDVNISSSTNYKFVGTTMGITDNYKTYSIADDGSYCQREAVTALPFRAYVKAMSNARTSAKAPISFTAIINVEPDEAMETLKGDVNGDGVVDVADISAVIITMANNTSEDSVKAADVNGDGAVDVADISAIIIIMAN